MKEYRVKKLESDKSEVQVIRVSDNKEMLSHPFWMAAAKRACDYLNKKEGAGDESWMLAE